MKFFKKLKKYKKKKIKIFFVTRYFFYNKKPKKFLILHERQKMFVIVTFYGSFMHTIYFWGVNAQPSGVLCRSLFSKFQKSFRV